MVSVPHLFAGRGDDVNRNEDEAGEDDEDSGGDRRGARTYVSSGSREDST